jgi:kynurenine/2-aminoadipate aminotransferase
MDYQRFLNSISINRTLSPLRQIWGIQHRAGPAMISLGTGTPNPLCFPYESVTIKTKDGRTFTLKDQELNTALGYTDSHGLPCLIDWLTEFQKLIHDPPYARQQSNLNQLIIVPGSEDGQCKILEMILEKGDPILITEPAYPGVLSALRPLGVKFLPIAMDHHGADPESLQKILNRYCQLEKSDRNRPKVLVIQPNHCNPSGVSTILERRKEIYRLACEYDLLIVEDDPYYFLTFENQNPPPSFLSMDTEGRVLRLDSFSKVVSAGLRVGTLSGPRPLVEKVMMHIASSSLHASTFSQTMLFDLLSSYGQQGFLKHARSVAEFYENRCRSMLKAAERHLVGLAEWNRPSGGMFLWMNVFGVEDTKRMIMENGLKKMVILSPGSFFMCDDTKTTSYLRGSFSWASEEEMDEGFRRLAEMINEEKSRKDI